MRTALPLLALSALALAACQTSSLTDAEKAEVVETDTAFSGEMKEIDAEQSVISFVGGSDVIDHQGKFTRYTASVDLDDVEPANLEKATITAEIDLTSAVTDTEMLNGHLQKADFFNTASGSVATFESTSIVAKGGNQYDVTGDLTVKGHTQSVSFPAEITDEYITATYDFPRTDYGIGNDSYGAKLLDETVPVTVKLVFKK
jgi:polyisoprenoid-binding protein YceI